MGVKKAFTEELRYECGPYDLKFADNGISGEAVNTADYGKEKFSEVKIGGETAYIYTEEEREGAVHLVPDIDKLAVIMAEKDIRII